MKYFNNKFIIFIIIYFLSVYLVNLIFYFSYHITTSIHWPLWAVSDVTRLPELSINVGIFVMSFRNRLFSQALTLGTSPGMTPADSDMRCVPVKPLLYVIGSVTMFTRVTGRHLLEEHWSVYFTSCGHSVNRVHYPSYHNEPIILLG